jgi:hypothetical protein
MQAMSSTLFVILPVGRNPMAPKDKIIIAGIVKHPIANMLLLIAVSLIAAYAAYFDIPASFSI